MDSNNDISVLTAPVAITPIVDPDGVTERYGATVVGTTHRTSIDSVATQLEANGRGGDAFQVRRIAHSLDRALARADESERRRAAWHQHVTDVLHQEANDRGYCSEADDVFERIGIDRRTRTWDIMVTVPVDVTVTVTANDEDAAGEAVDPYDVAEALNGRSWSRYDIGAWEVGAIDPNTD